MNPRFRTILWLALMLCCGPWLVGCAVSLCTKHLYIFRDTPEKTVPTTNLALLITDPAWVQVMGLTPGNYPEAGCLWAEERPSYERDAYRLTIDKLDGNSVFQGWCFDSPPTYFCEVRPGKRQVRVKFEMFGPWGQDSSKETSTLVLEPGGIYFLRPDCEALRNHRYVLKAERLAAPYSADLRARLIERRRQTMKGIAD